MTDTVPHELDSALLVDEVMRRWPATIGVFLRHRMLCIGCLAATYCTVNDACGDHGMETAPFLAKLRAAIETPSRA